MIYLKNALTGALDFHTKFRTKGFTYSDIVRNLTGNATFEIKDGRFMGIGKIENIVKAQNITTNSLLKTAISGLSTLNTIQKTDKFDKITGYTTFSNGQAKINNIKVYGPLMSYYVTGTYYIITNSATLKILGRLDTSIVSCLGVLGSFSAEKLVGAIPKIGQKTLEYLQKFTEKPETENISLIPALTSGSTSYKDFKVIYTGNIQKVSSVRTFKWLSKCDTTQIDLKKEVVTTIEDVKEDITKSIETTKNNIFIIKNNLDNIINAQKKKLEETIKTQEPKQQQQQQQSSVSSESASSSSSSTTTEKKEQKSESSSSSSSSQAVKQSPPRIEETEKTTPDSSSISESSKQISDSSNSNDTETSGNKPDVSPDTEINE